VLGNFFFLYILDKQRWINVRGYLQFDPIPERNQCFLSFQPKVKSLGTVQCFEGWTKLKNEISTFQNIIADLIPTSLLNQYGEELWRKPKVINQTILNS